MKTKEEKEKETQWEEAQRMEEDEGVRKEEEVMRGQATTT